MKAKMGATEAVKKFLRASRTALRAYESDMLPYYDPYRQEQGHDVWRKETEQRLRAAGFREAARWVHSWRLEMLRQARNEVEP